MDARPRSAWLATLLACVGWLISDSAFAADPTNATCAQLRQGSDSARLSAVQQLVASKSAQATSCIASAVTAGQHDAVTDGLIEALGELGSPAARATLTQLTRHRRALARAAAYRALSRLHDASTAPNLARLENGLRDSDEQVRGVCAKALGELGAKDAIELLFRSLARGVGQAAPAIGQLGDRASLTRYASMLGSQPLDVMLSGYERYLQRSDLDEPSKLQIVASLEELGGERVRAFLQGLLARPDFKKSPALTKALLGSVQRLKPAANKSVVPAVRPAGPAASPPAVAPAATKATAP